MRDRYEALIDYLAKKFDDSSCSQSTRKGCNNSQLSHLMKVQNVGHLPKLYHDFMCAFGEDSGGLISVGKFTYKYAINFKNFWGATVIPSDAYIFFSDLENFAYCFLTNSKEDDPLIYLLSENPDDGHLQLSKYISLSEFIMEWMDSVLDVC
ncbi:MAG: hypothetical protein Phog2KO_07210 [Phototrophicaceae bacterium]